jgi:hypothetical protein
MWFNKYWSLIIVRYIQNTDIFEGIYGWYCPGGESHPKNVHIFLKTDDRGHAFAINWVKPSHLKLGLNLYCTGSKNYHQKVTKSSVLRKICELVHLSELWAYPFSSEITWKTLNYHSVCNAVKINLAQRPRGIFHIATLLICWASLLTECLDWCVLSYIVISYTWTPCHVCPNFPHFMSSVGTWIKLSVTQKWSFYFYKENMMYKINLNSTMPT